MNLQNIGVIGAGTMGNGIAQVCALAGFNVTLLDISEIALQKALATVGKNLDRQSRQGNPERQSKTRRPRQDPHQHRLQQPAATRNW